MDKESKRRLKKEKIGELVALQQELLAKVKRCESLRHQLNGFSDHCVDRIRFFNKNIKAEDVEKLSYVLKHFIMQWFRTFLGFKDEAMVLFKGELTRKYFEQEHSQFIHDRGPENRYYKNSKHLSSCSVDGIDYEYRKLDAKYEGNDNLGTVADRNEEITRRLEHVADEMDSNAEKIKAILEEMGAFKIQIETANRQNKHNGETVLVVLKQGGKPISYKRTDVGVVQGVSRNAALHTEVEDPQNTELSSSLKNNSTKNNSIKSISESRRRGVIVDRDDIEQQKEELLKQTNEIAKLQLKKEKDALNFDISVSLDEIKRAYGSNNLQSTFVGIDDFENGAVSIHDESSQDNKTKQISSSLPNNDEIEIKKKETHNMIVSPVQRRLNKSVATENLGIPKSEHHCIHVRVRVPKDIISNVGGQFINMKINMSTSHMLMSQVDATKIEWNVKSGDILDEVYRRLWSHLSAGSHAPFAILPQSIRVGKHIYKYSTIFHYHKDRSSIFVDCYDSPILNKAMNNIAAHIRKDYKHRSDILSANKLCMNLVPFVPNYELLVRMANCFSSIPNTFFDSKALYLDLSRLGSTLIAEESSLALVLGEIYSIPDFLRYKFCIDLAHTILNGSLLSQLMLSSTRIDASNCSLNGFELKICAEILKCYIPLAEIGEFTNPENSFKDRGPNVSIKKQIIPPLKHTTQREALQNLPSYLRIEEINLRHNPLFDLVDVSCNVGDDKISALEVYLSTLLSLCPDLDKLDLSYCISDENSLEHGESIFNSILNSIKSCTAALKTINIKGLQSSMLTHYNGTGKHANDLIDNFISTCQNLYKKKMSIDVSGVNRYF